MQLVANMGGLMGLCMGFSVVSLAEIVYHVVLNPLLKFFSNTGREKKKIEPAQETRMTAHW